MMQINFFAFFSCFTPCAELLRQKRELKCP